MKRFVTMLLLGALLAILAGCGQNGTGSDTTGTQPTAPASVATSSAADAEASSARAGTTETAAAASAASGAAAGTMPNLNGRRVLIGTDATYPPFESVEQGSDAIVGFDVDVMNELAKLINIQPEFQNAKFDTIFTALQSGQFDAVMSAATITDERKKIVAFSDPYIDVGQLVVVASDNTTITSHEDLATAAAVGVQTGTTGEESARTEAQVPDANLRRYETIDLAFADLANGAIDAIVADGPTVGNYASQEQYQDKVKVVGEPFTTESYGIAVQQDDTELLNAINAGLAELKANGTIDRLKEQYNIR